MKVPYSKIIVFHEKMGSACESDHKYPALCTGTYNLDEDKISFTHDCEWIAEFDWFAAGLTGIPNT